jgi:hypothetical protein
VVFSYLATVKNDEEQKQKLKFFEENYWQIKKNMV